jgi:CcmD family protein
VRCGAPEETLFNLMIVPLVVWIGVAAFIFSLDRKIARLEARHREDDL